MKLSEQIRPHSQYWDCYNDEPLPYDHNNKLVKIAENFAIEFAEWLAENHYILFNIDKLQSKIWKNETHYFDTKMLLRKFKQEKKL